MTASPNAGHAFVHRFLLPLIDRHFGARGRDLTCLHLSTADDDEAAALRETGNRCYAVPAEDTRATLEKWNRWTVIASGRSLPFPPASFDLIFTGAFGSFSATNSERRKFTAEMRDLLKPGGALMISTGNIRCPVDLSRAQGVKVALEDLEGAFEEWSEVRRLSAGRYFGWGTVPGPLRLFIPLAEQYVRWSSNPARPRRYGSRFNSFFILWAVR